MCAFKTPVKNRGYPLFAPFLTLFRKNGVNKGTLRGVRVGDQVPHLPPESLTRTLEALFCLPEPHLPVIMPQEGVGVTLGAPVRHLVTYPDPPLI